MNKVDELINKRADAVAIQAVNAFSSHCLMLIGGCNYSQMYSEILNHLGDDYERHHVEAMFHALKEAVCKRAYEKAQEKELSNVAHMLNFMTSQED